MKDGSMPWRILNMEPLRWERTFSLKVHIFTGASQGFVQ